MASLPHRMLADVVRTASSPAANTTGQSLRRVATPALLVAIPMLLFLAFFHVATLDIGNAGWLIRASDNGENALGAHA